MKKIELEQAIILKSVLIEGAEDAIKKLREERRNLEGQLEESKNPKPRFYKGQPVTGSGGLSLRAKGFYIETVDDNGDCRFKLDIRGGATIWVAECKPDLTFKSIINWIEWNGGECPVDKDDVVVRLHKNGNKTIAAMPTTYNWKHSGAGMDTILYAVINLPEWV